MPMEHMWAGPSRMFPFAASVKFFLMFVRGKILILLSRRGGKLFPTFHARLHSENDHRN